MIVALFVLSLAMLLGGLAAVVQGIPFIRLEMGWTMVIAGSVVMSGGAILVGITTAVWRLRRIERELGMAREAVAARPYAMPPEAGLGAEPPLPTGSREPAMTIPAPVMGDHERLAPDERAVLAAGDIAPAPAPPDALHSTTDEAMDRLDLTPAAEAWTPDAEARKAATARARAIEEGREASSDAAPEVPAPRVVAGTYSSGGNNYVMYTDGSIEAETSTGNYTFKSLEELKAFASREEAPAGREVA